MKANVFMLKGLKSILTIQEVKDKFKDLPILDKETLKDALYQLNNQLQSTLDVVAPLSTNKRSKHKKSHGIVAVHEYANSTSAHDTVLEHRFSPMQMPFTS